MTKKQDYEITITIKAQITAGGANSARDRASVLELGALKGMPSHQWVREVDIRSAV